MPLSQWVSFLIAGLGIGWLGGLAVSPVASSIITALMGIVGGGFAGARMVKPEAGEGLDARPAALLILGVALGVSAGIPARTYGILGPLAPHELAAQQAGAPNGYARRAGVSVLYAASVAHCDDFEAAPPRLLKAALATSDLPWAPPLADAVDDTETLHGIVRALCSWYRDAQD